ncbi:MAG: NTP transferase domain-containing protein [Kiritimatiellae bacterium]|nr:NTP transferase domain-containing protein [Kiritimatiellia bacterium]
MKPTLVILAAGMGSRYGGLKQVDPVGPGGETIMDYSVFDAVRAGFGRVVFVIRRDFEAVFRERIGAKYAHAVEIDYAFQDKADLPAGFTLPPDREKPWGTAHAVRAARGAVDTPFAAINADDFYGRDAFQKVADFLAAPQPSGGPLHFAMVGYKLDLTLSDNGSVARGICHVDEAGRLTSVVEMTKLVRTPEGAENREDPAAPVRLTGQERVSMNLWGFTPALFDVLESRFPVWLEAHQGQPKAEWYIPFVVDELIHEGKAEVTVLPTDSSWFGVTYREDKPFVVGEIAKLIQAGEYPETLWKR